MSVLSHHERIINCLQGIPQKGQPFAFWRHFPEVDQTSEGLARATIEWQKKWDFDFIKVTPSGSYAIHDYGVHDVYTGDPYGRRFTVRPLVTQPDQWVKMKPLDPESGFLGQQIHSIKLMKSAFGNSVPLIQTIFSPLAQLEKMSGSELLHHHMNAYPDAVKMVLKVLTFNTVSFIRACIHAGIEGIYYVVRANLPEREALNLHHEFGMPYDLTCLKAANKLWLNILHLHAQWCHLSAFELYDTALVGMDSVQDPEKLKTALVETRFLGGFYRHQMVDSESDIETVFSGFRKSLDNHFIGGANCALALATPEWMINKARNLVQLGFD